MTDELIRALSKLKEAKVLVIGDVMLDEHIWSKVNRISPEAPVPVAEVTSKTYAPGGAGNVASNIRALGGNVKLLGIVGTDDNAEKLREVLETRGIETDLLIGDSGRPTTFKSRVIAHGQQVVRVDYEQKKPLSAQIEARILEAVNLKLREVDAVLISDYAKGIITAEISEKVIAAARALGKIVSIDPKGSDYNKYRGATIVTPNRREAEAITGMLIVNEKDVVAAGRRLLDNLKLEYVLITRGEDGMSLVGKDDLVTHIPAVTTEVYDVTGAGDTVVATLTLALAAGISIGDAVRLANWAAGVVVRKVGTATATSEEMEQAIGYDTGTGSNRKIVSLHELRDKVKDLREKGAKTVFTNGCFDLLHLGHVKYLQEAKSLGDVLIVGINSDDSAREIKGKSRPLIPEKERAQIVAALESVDFVVVFSETTPEKLIEVLKPDVQVKGGDYRGKKLPEAELVNSYGGKVVIVSEVAGKSTSGLIERIKRLRP
ncbi:bifunctional D-glycero-beta-D-manno-heptose-7-phosphate kinase/D-glycero-beta-D-manno-heptose 1-phosphate adenylyltransferase HldE [Chloroflexota bacterium]